MGSDGERLRRLRDTLRLTQRELAEEWGASPASIAKWELGQNPLPGPVRKLLELYEVELGGAGPKSTSFLADGLTSFSAYGAWVLFRRGLGASSGTAHQVQTRQLANLIAKHPGMASKLAQRVAFLDPMLTPDERAALLAVRSEAKRITAAGIHAVFRDVFGKAPQALFARWDPSPIGRGGVGQVHRAELHDGTRVAVKVQDPQAPVRAHEDLALVPMLEAWIRHAWPAQTPHVVFAELGERLVQECDYDREARTLQTARAAFSHDARIHVPTPIAERCGGPILTTTWCDGVPWAAHVQRATIERRREIAEIAWDAYFGALYRHGLINADPHPANILFQDDGTVVLLDFGFAKEVSASFRAFMHEISRAMCERRWLDVAKLARSAMLATTDDVEIAPRAFVWQWLPMLVDDFHVGPLYLEDLYRALLEHPPNREVLSMSRDTVCLHLTQLSLYAMLASLDVRVDYRRRLMAILYPEGDAPPGLTADELAVFNVELARYADRAR